MTTLINFRRQIQQQLATLRGAAVVAAERLSSSDFYRNPYPLYDRLRQTAPVWWNPLQKLWFVTGYPEAEAVYKSPQTGWGEPPFRGNRPLHFYEKVQARSLIFLDSPAHTRLRRLLQRPLAGFDWEPLIRRRAAGLLAGLRGKQTLDLIADYAAPLATSVILDVIGVPEADWPGLRPVLADQLATFEIERAAAIHERGDASMRQLLDYFAELVARRRRQPEPDLISAFLTASAGGDRLSDDEVALSTIMLTVGGYDNVISLIANAGLALLTRPELAPWRREPAALPGLLSETLRLDPPILLSYRRALEPLCLGEANIAPGDGLVIVIAAANRDPRRFVEPERFDPTRGTSGLAFGLGIHTCLGARLALDEARLALGLLLERYPRLELAASPETLEYRPSLMFRRLKALPVRLA